MRHITWPLAAAQTIVWAAIFYLFPALLLVWERELGWSKPELTGAFTLALLTSALFSTQSGKLIDQHHGRKVMLGGITGAVICLALLSQVSLLWQFYAVWFVLGICMAATLYEPCFAVLTHHLGEDAKKVITRITLVAGFAGTVSFPVANVLADAFGWRVAVGAFATAVLFVTLPLTIIALNGLQALRPVTTDRTKSVPPLLPDQRRTLILFSAGFVMLSIDHGMIINHLLPMLAERNVSQSFALLAASLIGPMQVAGRLLMMATESRVSTFASTAACFAGMALAAFVLWFAGAGPVLILLFVFLQGASWGTLSILRPAMTRDITQGRSFGAISGRIFAISIAGAAIAPVGGAWLWQAGGYSLMMGVVFALATLGFILLLMSRPKAIAG